MLLGLAYNMLAEDMPLANLEVLGPVLVVVSLLSTGVCFVVFLRWGKQRAQLRHQLAQLEREEVMTLERRSLIRQLIYEDDDDALSQRLINESDILVLKRTGLFFWHSCPSQPNLGCTQWACRAMLAVHRWR